MKCPTTQLDQNATAQSAIGDCTKVCGDVKSKIKANGKKVEEEYRQWQERLGIKSERLDVRIKEDLQKNG